MNYEVNKWVTDNYNYLRETTLNITKEPEVVDDLLHECILMFMENKKAAEVVKQKDKQARWFFIRIILNQYRSKTSHYHKTYRKNKTIELNETINKDEDETYDYDYDELINYNIEIIEDMLTGKDNNERYLAFIVMMYFSNDMNFAEVARLLKVSRSTIRRQFDLASKIIIQKMKIHDKNIHHKEIPLKLLATKLLRGYGKNRRY